MADEKPTFTNINSIVCLYCKSLMRSTNRDGEVDGCGLVQNDKGEYAYVVLGEPDDDWKNAGIDYIPGNKGCEQFDASGLSTHPDVLEELVKENPKCSKIPVDSEATETAFEFNDKLTGFMYKNFPRNIGSYSRIKIQREKI